MKTSSSPTKSRDKHYLMASISIAGLFFTLIVYRAFILDITYDESWTIGGFVPMKVEEIITQETPGANNHILNTLLIKFFTQKETYSLILARLPNILASLLFLTSSILIIRHYIKGWQGIALLLILLCNPFMLDFFSLARGYGLSIGFLMLSLYYLLRFHENRKPTYSAYCVALLFPAIWSNLTLIHTAVVIIPLIFYLAFTSSNAMRIKLLTSCSLLIILAIIIRYTYVPIVKLTETNQLWYGGKNGFYVDTMSSLVRVSAGDRIDSSATHLWLNILILITMAIYVSWFFSSEKTLREKLHSRTFLLITIFLGTMLVSVMQHWLIGTKFLTDRTALFYFPLWVSSLGMAVSETSHRTITNKITSELIAFLSLISVINFAAVLQPSVTITWFHDAHTEEILCHINDVGSKKQEIQRVNFAWCMRSPLFYYLDTKKFPYVETAESEMTLQDTLDYDYYVYMSRSLENVGYYPAAHLIDKMPFEKDLEFLTEDVVVYRVR